MAVSTTFRQCAPETTKFGKITLNKCHFAVQCHSRSPIWYQSKLICDFLLVINSNLPPILHRLAVYSISNVRNHYISLPLLRFNPPMEGFPWDDLRKIFTECQWNEWMAKIPDGEEKLTKISAGWVGRTAPTLQIDDRRTDRTAIYSI